MITWKGGTRPECLEPQFYQDVVELLSHSPYSWYVTFGHRSLEQQAELYRIYRAGGAKAAPPGKSPHNFGLAVDVVLDIDSDRPGLQASWNTVDAGWVWLFDALEAHPRLHSGVGFGDGGHIEKANWTAHKGWK